MKKVGRNDRCPCGSGKKFKNCCEGKQVSRRGGTPLWVALLVGGVIVLGAAGLLASYWGGGGGGDAAPNRVWSPEHGHWHTVGGGGSGNRTLPSRPAPQPSGPTPAGKVWSPEHGHWHDVP